MGRCMITLILDVGRSMKWMMTFNLCLIPLKKILEINYKYGYLKQPTDKEILWRVTISFILSDDGLERGVIWRKTKITRRGKYLAK